KVLSLGKNILKMNLHERKLSLIEWLVSLKDKDMVAKIENMKNTKTARQEIKPMTLKEFYKIIDESEQDIKSGKVYAHEEVSRYLKRKR
ncbi:MAG: hypothetical protein ABI855_20260, partial [Bacteroidota bacterium]